MLPLSLSTTLLQTLPTQDLPQLPPIHALNWPTKGMGYLGQQNVPPLEAYQLGQCVGQLSRAFEACSSPQHSFLEHLLTLADWWSTSELINHGWLNIDPNCNLEPFISLQVVLWNKRRPELPSYHRDAAFYAGIISGFFSAAVKGNFEVIQVNDVSTDHNDDMLYFLLGHLNSLDSSHFWQSFDVQY